MKKAIISFAFMLAIMFCISGTKQPSIEQQKNQLHNVSSYALITGREGFRPAPYICAGGKLTIGYGTRAKPGDAVSEEQAIVLMEQHLEREVRPYIRSINVDLNSCQKAALESLIYNIGSSAFSHSQLRRAIVSDIKNREAIEKEWREFRLIKGIPSPWLMEWREKELDLFFKPGCY